MDGPDSLVGINRGRVRESAASNSGECIDGGRPDMGQRNSFVTGKIWNCSSGITVA